MKKLLVNNKRLYNEWDFAKNKNIDITKILQQSNKKVWWKCKYGHEWESAIYNRTAGSNCPYCSGRIATLENCLPKMNNKLCKEWNYKKNKKIDINKFKTFSHKKVWWKCKHGHEWEANISTRSRGSGCPYCCNQVVCRKNSLGHVNKKLLKEWNFDKNKISPYEIAPNSGKSVWWKCKKGHEWESVVASRNKGVGCPYCSHNLVSEENKLTFNKELLKEWDYKKNINIDPEYFSYGNNKKVWWKCKKCNFSWMSRISHRSDGHGCPKCKKIVLKNGTFCDSLTEAFFYLQFKEKGLSFLHNKSYGGTLKKSRYDFYFPDYNTYVEVTSFNKKHKVWDLYIKKINKKRRYVNGVLKAKFQFFQIKMTKDKLLYVRSNMA